MMSNFQCYLHGAQPVVRRQGSTLWLSVPLSESGSPTILMFLDVANAVELAKSLAGQADLARRVAELERDNPMHIVPAVPA